MHRGEVPPHVRQQVSIRSHPGGWEMPSTPATPSRSHRFQSAPTPEGGRCAFCTANTRWHPSVSIRSHPGGWEMRHCPVISRHGGCFNPLPPRRVGDASPLPRHSRTGWRFNPLPPRRVGDAPLCRRSTTHLGFNPLPPRRVGDARTSPTWCIACTFQSAPTPEGGRCVAAQAATAHRQGFNPLPPRRVGDA